MRLIILILGLSFSITACAMGGRAPKQTAPRKMSDKLFRPCKAEWITGDRLGKFCNRRCIDIKSDGCNKWETKVIDSMIEKDFVFMENGSFILIDEDQVL